MYEAFGQGDQIEIASEDSANEKLNFLEICQN